MKTQSQGFSGSLLIKQNPYVRFMFDPPDDQNGANQNQNPNPNQNPPGTPPSGTPAPVWEDPFKDMDLSIYDDATKTAIEKTRADARNFAGQAAAASKYQSQADAANANLQRLQKELEGRQTPNTPTKTQDPTLEEEILQTFLDEGLPLDQAKKAARLQAKIMERGFSKHNSHINKALAPTLDAVVDHEVNNNFQSAVQMSPWLGQDEELAEEVWKTVKAAAQSSGQALSIDAIVNISKIKYADALIKDPSKAPTQPTIPVQQQQSRFSYPGAGNRIAPVAPARLSGTPPNADTMRALEVIQGNWNATLNKNPQQSRGKITRGGV